MVIGVLILLLVFKVGIDNFNYAIQLDNWTKENQQKLILFYPTKKDIQDQIKEKFIPKIPYEILEVYYDGPALIGDIKRSMVLEIMKWNPKVKVNSPSILKIVGKSVIYESLEQLKEIDTNSFDSKPLLDKIEKVKNSN